MKYIDFNFNLGNRFHLYKYLNMHQFLLRRRFNYWNISLKMRLNLNEYIHHII